MNNTLRTRRIFVLLILFITMILSALLSLSLGSVNIPFIEVLHAILRDGYSDSEMIIMQFRMPRILGAILVGGALAVAGALLQGIIRNPLASPDVIGVTGGASVSVVAVMTFATGVSIHWLPFVAIAGAMITAAINYLFAWKAGVSPYRLVMIGVGISTAAGALTTLLLISGPAYLAAQVLNWTTGSLYGTSWAYIDTFWPWMTLFMGISLFFSKELNIQLLGDETAIGLGSRLQLARLFILIISVVLAGSAVGIAGGLSFIGLLAPHIARGLIGSTYQYLLPASMMTGAIILLLADLAGRLLFQPLDIPAGVFTAAVGTPFFIYILFSKKRMR